MLELIGVGGMGAVFKARQPKLDRLVALKILSRELAGDPAFVERFDREARVLARLSHPKIVSVFDCGMAGPFAYLMMEFVDGVNLRQAMQAGGFAASEALTLVQDVCGALKFAHEKGILHRDIKPENILIDSTGTVKIADFGIAKLVGENEPSHVTLTMQGAVLGSPRYMAPEQFDTPGDVDQRADIYSLGVVLYELLTGDLPMGRFAPPSQKSAVDARIDEIVMRTLERERELRFQTVGEVKTRMEDVTHSAGGGMAVSPSTRTPDISPTARRATTAAVCTGISLVMAVAAAAYIYLLMELTRSRTIVSGEWVAILGAGTLVAVVPAVLGTVFGGGALREVRASSGKKRGFLRGIFAVATWPGMLVAGMLGIVAVTFLSAKAPFAGRNILVGGLLLLAAGLGIAMIRRIVHWARNDPSISTAKPSIWRFLASTLAAAVCFATAVINDPALSLRKLLPGAVATAPAVAPLVELTAQVPAGMAASFRLVRVDADGGETHVGASGSMIAPDDEPLSVTLRYGQTGMINSGRAVEWQIITECESAGQRFSTTTEFSGHWQFEKNDTRELALQQSKTERLKLASSLVQNAPETLYIEIITGQRPVLPHPGPAPVAGLVFALKKGVIGFDTPEALIRRASVEQKPAHE